MKKLTPLVASLTLSLCLLVPTVSSAAGVLEQILANPRVQALLSKPLEVTNALNLCANEAFKSANVQTCAEAANAQIVLRLPFEMRTVMSNANSAQSLRDLCLAAQSTPQGNSYLCAELVKADSTFAAAVAAQKARGTAGAYGADH